MRTYSGVNTYSKCNSSVSLSPVRAEQRSPYTTSACKFVCVCVCTGFNTYSKCSCSSISLSPVRTEQRSSYTTSACIFVHTIYYIQQVQFISQSQPRTRRTENAIHYKHLHFCVCVCIYIYIYIYTYIRRHRPVQGSSCSRMSHCPGMCSQLAL
jgi:hypothetical protein